MTYPLTPTLDKIKSVHEESDKIGTFLDWLRDEKHIRLAAYTIYCSRCRDNGHGENCFKCAHPPDAHCSHLDIIHDSFDELLHEYFGIDEKEEEKEKRAVLEWIRNQNRGTN